MGTVPLEIVKGEVSEILSYLRAIAKGSDFYSKVKLMFVGEGKLFFLPRFHYYFNFLIQIPPANVGKSSLLSSFVNLAKKKKAKKEITAPPEPNVATDGIDIADTNWDK